MVVFESLNELVVNCFLRSLALHDFRVSLGVVGYLDVVEVYISVIISVENDEDPLHHVRPVVIEFTLHYETIKLL